MCYDRHGPLGTPQQGYAPRGWQPPLDTSCGGFKAEGGHGKDKRSNVAVGENVKKKKKQLNNVHIFLLALITLLDFLLKSRDHFYFPLNVPEMSVTQTIIQVANSSDSHQKIRQKIVFFHPLLVEAGPCV